MRRKDREITDKAELLDILRRCDNIRLGMVSEGEPYVVPISFGFEEAEGQVHVYFHSAPIGRKVAALEQNPAVCVEADIFYRNETTPHGITARYESIIGFGRAQRIEGEELLHGLRCILEHYGYDTYAPDNCRYLPTTAGYKITLSSLSGKRNMPKSAADSA